MFCFYNHPEEVLERNACQCAPGSSFSPFQANYMSTNSAAVSSVPYHGRTREHCMLISFVQKGWFVGLKGWKSRLACSSVPQNTSAPAETSSFWFQNSRWKAHLGRLEGCGRGQSGCYGCSEVFWMVTFQMVHYSHCQNLERTQKSLAKFSRRAQERRKLNHPNIPGRFYKMADMFACM